MWRLAWAGHAARAGRRRRCAAGSGAAGQGGLRLGGGQTLQLGADVDQPARDAQAPAVARRLPRIHEVGDAHRRRAGGGGAGCFGCRHQRQRALAGGLLGGALAWLVFNGYSASTMGSNFSAVVFQFKVTPELLWTGLKWALGIGLVGGLFPALRAARLPITAALRAV